MFDSALPNDKFPGLQKFLPRVWRFKQPDDANYAIASGSWVHLGELAEMVGMTPRKMWDYHHCLNGDDLLGACADIACMSREEFCTAHDAYKKTPEWLITQTALAAAKSIYREEEENSKVVIDQKNTYEQYLTSILSRNRLFPDYPTSDGRFPVRTAVIGFVDKQLLHFMLVEVDGRYSKRATWHEDFKDNNVAVLPLVDTGDVFVSTRWANYVLLVENKIGETDFLR